MATVTIANTQKDHVARSVWGVGRSALADSGHVVDLDYACTAALNRVNGFASRLDGVAVTKYAYAADNQTQVLKDDVWYEWWRLEAIASLASSYRPERKADLIREREEAMDDAIDLFSKAEPDNSTLSGTAFTPAQVRAYVMLRCAKRRADRLWPDAPLVDTAMQEVINELWNSGRWNFRRRRATLTIPTNQVVTITFTDDNTSAFDSFASAAIYIRPSSSSDDSPRVCKLMDGTQAAYLRADTNQDDGTPRWFRWYDDGDGTLTWEFFPAPDASYTADAEIFIKPPTISDSVSATSATELARFPTEFRPVIKELTYGKVLVMLNAIRGGDYDTMARQKVEPLLPVFEERGVPTMDLPAKDVYQDRRAQTQPLDDGWIGDAYGGGML